jgi:hypothetical protein
VKSAAGGGETPGTVFERDVLDVCLPCSLEAMDAQAKKVGFPPGWSYGARDHFRHAVIERRVRRRP